MCGIGGTNGFDPKMVHDISAGEIWGGLKKDDLCDGCKSTDQNFWLTGRNGKDLP